MKYMVGGHGECTTCMKYIVGGHGECIACMEYTVGEHGEWFLNWIHYRENMRVSLMSHVQEGRMDSG